VSGVDVDLGVLATIAADLDAGADGLEGLAGGVPSGVDAGLMTAVVSSMLSQVVTSAANVSTSLGATADAVRECRRYYQRADAGSGTGFDEIRRVMNP
jgi:hypothetical protein